ncbi:MAG: TonB-dependent receptor [Paracoccaceae bacterium]
MGIEKRYGDRAAVRATAFWLEVDNLIDFDFASVACGSGFGCYNQVPGTSRRTGVELEGEVALNDMFTIGANYTYTDSATSATTAWGSVPRHALGLSLGAEITPEISGTLNINHAADRAGLPDYTVANLALDYDFGNDTRATLRVENLFDEQYQLVSGYGTSGRAIYVGLAKSF